MIDKHPITPPDELKKQWMGLALSWQETLNIAARWGADQELEACCLELVDGIGRLHLEFPSRLVEDIRFKRRPNPPSLKEQALARLTSLEELAESMGHSPDDTIRRALERLKELEAVQ